LDDYTVTQSAKARTAKGIQEQNRAALRFARVPQKLGARVGGTNGKGTRFG
jgi:hypothetical protein